MDLKTHEDMHSDSCLEDAHCISGYKCNVTIERCRDVDECLGSNPCGKNAICINTEGKRKHTRLENEIVI